jgi:transcriptional regulator with XRE-family HTH domain
VTGTNPTGINPTALQRELGTRLRELRNERGLTIENVAEELLCSATKISRLETGARRPNLRDVRDLCVLYKVDESTSAELMKLARDAREPGWWTQYEDLDLDPLIGLEQEAAAITCFSMYYMPGLLQTENYARAIIKAVAPKMSANIYRQRIEARLRRQQLLEEDHAPRYRVLLDEAVLHRRVGGPAVMAAQLDKALEAVHSPKVTIQVIPFDVGAYAAADGYFVLLEFEEDSNLWPVVYIEGLTGNQYLQREADIARYRETIEYLYQHALTSQDSVDLIIELRKNYIGG